MKKIYIAPIAGVTDYTFRGILEDFKPDLIFTEMVSVNALSVLNDKTISKILKLRDGNAVQIFGEDIEKIKERLDALKKLTTIRDCYNEGWEPNWNDNNEKYTIKPLKDEFMLCCAVKEKATLYFKSIEIATKFFEEQRKLIEIAKPLL